MIPRYLQSPEEALQILINEALAIAREILEYRKGKRNYAKNKS
jgi:hypothetical protein